MYFHGPLGRLSYRCLLVASTKRTFEKHHTHAINQVCYCFRTTQVTSADYIFDCLVTFYHPDHQVGELIWNCGGPADLDSFFYCGALLELDGNSYSKQSSYESSYNFSHFAPQCSYYVFSLWHAHTITGWHDSGSC